MAKPVVQNIKPFDATNDYVVELSWLGSRAYKNRIIIKNNTSNDTVYDQIVTTFQLKHTIPANTLTNGGTWTIQAQVYDENNTPSALSDKTLFYTITTPDFYIQNVPETVDTSYYTASLYYNSADLEILSSYRFYLYDSTYKELYKSEEIYDLLNLSHTYNGLDNNTLYYIRCTGITVHKVELDTGYVPINVYYENPDTYSRIYATTLPNQGCVHIATNLVVVQYNGEETFEYDNGMINLIDKTLYYDEGFLVEKDFTLVLRGVNLWQTAEILKMKNEKHGLILSSHIYTDNRLRFKISVPNGTHTYIIYSEPQTFDSNDMITVVVRRINNIYQLRVFVEINANVDGNIWYGSTLPMVAQINDVWLDTNEPTHMVDINAMQTFLENDEPISASLYDLWIGGD